jgi:hypothetical protein
MTAKGKRAHISKEKEKEIITLVWENPDMPPKLLADRLLEKIKWKGKVPEFDVLKKKVLKYRNHEKSPQEGPWSTATLGDYPIPPEALPKVLEIWKLTLHSEEISFENNVMSWEERLTIREAKWAARLSAVKPPEHKIIGEGPKTTFEGADWLLALATWYARHEELNEILGHPFDSGELDYFLVGLPTKIGYEAEAKGGPGVKTTVRWKLRNLWEAPEWVKTPEWVEAGRSAEDIRGCLRGEGNSWQIIIDAGIDAKGKRKRHIETINGVEDDARKRLIELVFNPAKEGGK